MRKGSDERIGGTRESHSDKDRPVKPRKDKGDFFFYWFSLFCWSFFEFFPFLNSFFFSFLYFQFYSLVSYFLHSLSDAAGDTDRVQQKRKPSVRVGWPLRLPASSSISFRPYFPNFFSMPSK